MRWEERGWKVRAGNVGTMLSLLRPSTLLGGICLWERQLRG